MVTCFYYWLIQPLREEFNDSAQSISAFEVPITVDNEILTLAVFTDAASVPEYARLTIPNVPDEVIPEKLLPFLQALKEHLVSSLKLTYHPETELFPCPIWTFSVDPATHRVGLKFTQQLGTPVFDPARAKRVFAGGFDLREDIRLLIDGADSRIPLQYRFLSAYKLLELEFKARGKWRKHELEEFLGPFAPRFKSIGVRAKPAAYLAELRDKCAHIKIGKKKERFGVTHLNHKEAAQVEKTLPVLGEIAFEILKIRGKGKLQIERRHWLQWQ